MSHPTPACSRLRGREWERSQPPLTSIVRIGSRWSSASFLSSSSVRSCTGWGMNTSAGSIPSDFAWAAAPSINSVVATPTVGMPRPSRSAMFMRTARNAGPSVGQSFDDEVDFGGDLLPQRQRRHARVGRLGVVLDGDAAFGDPLAETVQKHVAARFCDVENTNRQPVELLRPRQAHPNRRTSFRGWVEKDGQFLTSLVTGRLLREPPADQPAMIPENMPASPPARTIIIPPGRNLLTVLPASVAGPPSAMPLAPATRSSPGISHSRYSSSLTRAFDQPAFLKVR